MGRMYSLSFTDTPVTVSGDLFQLQAQTVPAIIHAAYISQTSDVGDAVAENLTLSLIKADEAVTDIGSGVPLDGGDTAALANVNVNRTTDRLTTSLSGVHVEAWNIAQTFVYLPPPEMKPVVQIGKSIVLQLTTPPADSITMNGTIYWEEFGN